MIRKSVVIAGMAAGFALLSPVAALAGSPNGVEKSLSISVSGSTVTLNGVCAEDKVGARWGWGVKNGHEPFGEGRMKSSGHKQTASFKVSKPGNYVAWFACDEMGEQGAEPMEKPFTVSPPQKETVKPKAPQVAEKPKGAPQTGGGAEAADDAGIGTAAAGAAAALAVGGAGFFALRRRRANQR